MQRDVALGTARALIRRHPAIFRNLHEIDGDPSARATDKALEVEGRSLAKPTGIQCLGPRGAVIALVVISGRRVGWFLGVVKGAIVKQLRQRVFVEQHMESPQARPDDRLDDLFGAGRIDHKLPLAGCRVTVLEVGLVQLNRVRVMHEPRSIGDGVVRDLGDVDTGPLEAVESGTGRTGPIDRGHLIVIVDVIHQVRGDLRRVVAQDQRVAPRRGQSRNNRLAQDILTGRVDVDHFL